MYRALENRDVKVQRWFDDDVLVDQCKEIIVSYLLHFMLILKCGSESVAL